ncbi:glycyl-radical enzyme activating protein [Sporomusa acidovorans]|nr:glycyl-radical enzyme activating protein [Sporomusa acidovorans]
MNNNEKKRPLTGKIYDIQGFSVQDGPGIRTTIFLKGCPLRCPWCHSPESQQFYNQLSWMAMRCVGVAKCGVCLGVCTRGAITPGTNTYADAKQEEIQLVKVDRSLCNNCGDCAKACSAEALYICGKDYTVDEVIERIRQDIPFYNMSGGGVTISGGEALAQPEFTLQVLKSCKFMGINTALDTTGYADFKYMEAVLPYTDLFLYDLKHMNSEMHQKVIGVPNERILDNAGKIAEYGGKMQIRIPVIPNFNDSKKNFAETGEFCKQLGEAVTVIQLLPYHNLGVVKYERLQQEGKVLEAKPPSEEKIKNLKQLLTEMGLTVVVH